MTENKQPLWTREFIFVSLINFIIMLSMFLLLVTIASYAVEEYHVDKSTAGLVSGIFIVGSLFGRFWAGKYIDIMGQKKILITGVIIFTVTTALYLISNGLPMLLIVRLLNGAGCGIASTATGTIAAFITPISRRGEGISYFSMSAVMATAVGPFLGMLLLQYITFQQLFYVCLALAFVALIMLPFIHIRPQTHQSAASKGFSLGDFIDKNALPIGSVVLVVCLTYSSILSFISFFTRENHLVTAGTLFFLVYAIFILISRPFTGRILDQKGTNIVMIPSFISYIIGLLLLSYTHSSWMLLVSAAFIGLGYGNFLSVAQTIAVKVTEPHKIGLATSTYFICLDFALGFGPYVLGALIPVLGMHGLYRTMSIVVLGGLMLYFIVHGRKAARYQ
ncbi:MFS transporter [Macrococcus hajekii]|uniref:MFS transporter n=1 Tax=Macrococcus hajekii TaxID=198482 RepID=A0A4R6BJT2_9STAP|nr:MFS transporter [Macrococcus hajekii]TDM01890.1 MFS transporter [Macrococcus hajekii]GGB08319.1 MFS transporter [Macrococcus hajekii]